MKVTIELTEEQLRLIQQALELYSRIGILQIERILDHPTIHEMIMDQHTSKKNIEVGDRTLRGEVVEIGEGSIKTRGRWSGQEEVKEWTDIEKIKLSPDWSSVHQTRDIVRSFCDQIKWYTSAARYSQNAGPGIHHDQVDESTRQAFDMIQVIRHEFWKRDSDRSDMTVDSSIHLTSSSPKIVVSLPKKDEEASSIS